MVAILLMNNSIDTGLSEVKNKINIEHLNMLISTANWGEVLRNIDTNRAYENCNNKINQLITLSSYNVIKSFQNRI